MRYRAACHHRPLRRLATLKSRDGLLMRSLSFSLGQSWDGALGRTAVHQSGKVLGLLGAQADIPKVHAGHLCSLDASHSSVRSYVALQSTDPQLGRPLAHALLMISLDSHDVMLGFYPSAEHKVHQSIGVTGQQPKCCIGACTRTPINVDNCHFGLWMPHTMVCERRSPHRQSTPASKFRHTHSTMAFMDKGAQVQPEVATYGFPQLRIMTTTTEYLRTRFNLARFEESLANLTNSQVECLLCCQLLALARTGRHLAMNWPKAALEASPPVR